MILRYLNYYQNQLFAFFYILNMTTGIVTQFNLKVFEEVEKNNPEHFIVGMPSKCGLERGDTCN